FTAIRPVAPLGYAYALILNPRIPLYVFPLVSQTRPPPTATLFPYTTLFRSRSGNNAPAWLMLYGDAAGTHYFGLSNPQNGTLRIDRKSTRLNSSHGSNSYAVFCLK